MQPGRVSTSHPARGAEPYRQAAVALLFAADDVAEAEARLALADLLARDGVAVARAVVLETLAHVSNDPGL